MTSVGMQMHEKYLHDQATLKECGIREGLEKGLEKGIEQGIKQGIEIGTKNTLLQNIRGLLENGISVEIIKKSLKCTDKNISKAKESV